MQLTVCSALIRMHLPSNLAMKSSRIHPHATFFYCRPRHSPGFARIRTQSPKRALIAALIRTSPHSAAPGENLGHFRPQGRWRRCPIPAQHLPRHREGLLRDVDPAVTSQHEAIVGHSRLEETQICGSLAKLLRIFFRLHAHVGPGRLRSRRHVARNIQRPATLPFHT